MAFDVWDKREERGDERRIAATQGGQNVRARLLLQDLDARDDTVLAIGEAANAMVARRA